MQQATPYRQARPARLDPIIWRRRHPYTGGCPGCDGAGSFPRGWTSTFPRGGKQPCCSLRPRCRNEDPVTQSRTHRDRWTLRGPARAGLGSREDLAGLLARSAGGDGAAFAALYDLTCARLYRLVLLVVGERGRATHLTQEAYLTIWLTAHTYRPSDGSVLGWLARIAHAHALASVGAAPGKSPESMGRPLRGPREEGP
ncbi:MAG: sigma factor [Pedococcus sp.]